MNLIYFFFQWRFNSNEILNIQHFCEEVTNTNVVVVVVEKAALTSKEISIEQMRFGKITKSPIIMVGLVSFFLQIFKFYVS
jgi:hypothetical protein